MSTVANNKYSHKELSGKITFDYSNNNGLFVVGNGDLAFETKWSKASDQSIHAYSDCVNIDSVALAKNISRFEDIKEGKSLDYSSRVRTVDVGEIVIFKNKNGFYVAIKVIDVKDDSRADHNDEITFEYVIQPDKSANFSKFKTKDNLQKRENISTSSINKATNVSAPVDDLFSHEAPSFIKHIIWGLKLFSRYLLFLKRKRIPFPRLIFTLSLIIVIGVLCKSYLLVFTDNGYFQYTFISSGYKARNLGIPTVIDAGFEGEVKNISSKPRYLQTFHYSMWRNEFLGRAWNYEYGVGTIYEINGNHRSTTTLPMLFQPNESKKLAWVLDINISDQEINDVYAEKTGEGVFTWNENSPKISIEDSRGNIFDDKGSLLSQGVVDDWWVLSNNRTVGQKIKAYSILTAKIVWWKIKRFFHWLS
ncbi:TPA: hypothetical protein DEP58_01290 [Patescibacteria group bacterium]|nr:MAG: hypothetical protein UU98_C0035G0008 [Parcubacteria group bacterium GW2011_GWD2_42_14]HCC04923.1 hypothetical protein [Patescibacteria group bacterium]